MNRLPSPQISGQVRSSEKLLTSPGIPIGPPGNPFTVFQVGYLKIKLVFMENRAEAHARFFALRGAKVVNDTGCDVHGDGVDAVVKDGAAIVMPNLM